MALSDHTLAGQLDRHPTLDLSNLGEAIMHPPPRHRPTHSNSRRRAHELHASNMASSLPLSSDTYEEMSPVQHPPQIPQRHSLRSPERLSSFMRHPERRVSDASVVTQIRVPTPASQDTAVRSNSRQASGRTTPRPRSPASEVLKETEAMERAFAIGIQEPKRRESLYGDNNSSITRLGQALPDGRLVSRRNDREDGQSIRTNMTRVDDYQTSASDSFTGSDENYRDQGNASAYASRNGNTLPVVPMKSPLRTHFIQDSIQRSQSRHARNSGSIDRNMHNSSVASSARQTESETAATSSDIFSQDESEEAYESDISSLEEDGEATSEVEFSKSPQPSSRGAHASQFGRAVGELTMMDDDPQMQEANRTLLSAPSAGAVYNSFASETDTNAMFSNRVSRQQSHLVPAPAVSPASSTHNPSTRSFDFVPDLSHRSPSPSLSNVSDAESSDSAVPPPVSLTRDSAGPRYKNVTEQKRGGFKFGNDKFAVNLKPRSIRSGNISDPSFGLAKSKTWTAAGKTSFSASADGRSPRSPRSPWSPGFRSGSATPSRSRAASRADSLPTTAFASGHYSSRSKSLSVVQPSTHTKTFNISLPSLSNLFGGLSFRNKIKKEPAALPALRKITFDSRGQKKVLDLNALAGQDLDANEIAERELFGNDPGSLVAPIIDAGEKKASADARRSISSQGIHATTLQDGQASQQGWRNREKGVPRRTAWK